MPVKFEDDLIVELAQDEDWEEIMPGYVEGTYMSLGPTEREDLGPGTVRERAAMQAEWIRGPEGFHNQAFVARTLDGRLVGHVWVARVLNQFTGRSEALILNIYVEEDFRNRGAAKRMMMAVHEWARGQGLERIGLSVGVDNEPAVRLYETLGFNRESQRMTRRL